MAANKRLNWLLKDCSKLSEYSWNEDDRVIFKKFLASQTGKRLWAVLKQIEYDKLVMSINAPTDFECKANSDVAKGVFHVKMLVMSLANVDQIEQASQDPAEIKTPMPDDTVMSDEEINAIINQRVAN